MIRNGAVGVPAKDLVNGVNELAAICRYGSDVVPAAPDLLRGNPSACAKIPKDGGRVFLRRFPPGDLLPDIFRFDGVGAVLKIQNQRISGVRFIQDGNFLRFFNQLADALEIERPVPAAEKNKKFQESIYHK